MMGDGGGEGRGGLWVTRLPSCVLSPRRRLIGSLSAAATAAAAAAARTGRR